MRRHTFQHTTISTIGFWVCSIALLALMFTSCEKTSDIGYIIRPDDDDIIVYTDSFHLNSRTVKAENLYSESEKLVLGSYSDNIYGPYKVDFLAEFRYVKDLTFPAGAESDSIYIVMYYRSFFGDSSAVQEASAYLLDKKPLDFSTNYTSSIDVSEFCSKNQLLGRTTYTAYDATIPAAIREKKGYCDAVRIRLSKDIATEMIAKTDIYKSQDAFLNYIKGAYVTTTYGMQTVLNIDSVNLELSYHYIPDSTKMDSLVYRRVIFPANKETTEVIRVESDPYYQYYKPDSVEYVSTPGGSFVEFDIPFEQIYNKLKQTGAIFSDTVSNINHFSLIMEPAVLEDADESARMTYPVSFVMIAKKDVEKFFTQSMYPAPNINTVLGVYRFNIEGRYDFGNGGVYIEEAIKAVATMSDTERKAYFDSLNPFQVIPISGNNDLMGTNAVIRHMFYPFGVRVRSGRNAVSPMRLVLTYTGL